MAEALLGVVFDNLFSLIQNEFATLSGVKREAEKLKRTLDLIKAVVEDAEKKQITDRFIKIWLQQLKDAVYVLDDILDECSIKSHQLGGLSSFKPKNIKFRHGIGNRLKEIAGRLDKIAEEKNQFRLSEGVRERPSEVAEWRQTSSIIAQPRVYGRDKDKEKIVEFLLSEARASDFISVYPIVGLGGMGKTTLAQLVYNDGRVSSHFDKKIWICVSENFAVKRILCSIIESITEEKYNILDLDIMGKKVQELLQGKRCLLILDDVWNRNQEFKFGLSQEKWNELKSVLTCRSKGASILVSTRDNDVALIMGTCKAHHLSGLSEDDCWLLFKEYAFGLDKEERPELVAIGKKIVKKCGGSPLAAQALGGLLRCNREVREWLAVKDSDLWSLPDENSILPALRLSYFHLTPTLKQCFAFCAIFPKDTYIVKEDLIHLWMANGFMSARDNLDVEDVGNMIYNELCQKSFFQEIKTYGGGAIYFKMHDLVHDLAQSIMGQECMILENDTNMTDLSRSTHHVSFGSSGEFSFNKEAFNKVESLRTVYQLGNFSHEFFGCFARSRSLRVLRTSYFKLSSLKNLIHLRYLELHGFKGETLPSSISKLRKLEILKLLSLQKLRCLPKDLSCLQNLRHLQISNCWSLSGMSPNFRKLSCLRSISLYIVRSEEGYSLAELCDLKLRGKLRIEGLENVCSVSEAQEANLMGKKDLHELELSWGIGGERHKSHATKTNAEQVLEALQPHSNLKTLRIYDYEGLHLPSWMGNNSDLSSLVALELIGSKNCRQLLALGKLPSLRKLFIYGMENVQYMDDDESYDGVEVRAFPSLEQLRVERLPKLERLLKVERGDMFLRLSDLFIEDCPKLRLPCLPSVTDLVISGCSSELLRSISSFNGLTSLELCNDGELTSLPEGMMTNLTCLKTLTIWNFQKLREVPYELTKLNALEHLQIRCCDELESFSEQVMEGLRSLRTLEIFECRGLRSLPEGVRHLTSLELLQIRYCDKLESFPEQVMEGLRSLRTLEISACRGLRSVPEGVRHLTSLERLSIYNCPALEERCKEGTGEDWHKIAHIPNVYLQ